MNVQNSKINKILTNNCVFQFQFFTTIETIACLETRDRLLIFYLFLNFVHSFSRQSIRVSIVNIVGIPTCSQHLLT